MNLHMLTPVEVEVGSKPMSQLRKKERWDKWMADKEEKKGGK